MQQTDASAQRKTKSVIETSEVIAMFRAAFAKYSDNHKVVEVVIQQIEVMPNIDEIKAEFVNKGIKQLLHDAIAEMQGERSAEAPSV